VLGDSTSSRNSTKLGEDDQLQAIFKVMRQRQHDEKREIAFVILKAPNECSYLVASMVGAGFNYFSKSGTAFGEAVKEMKMTLLETAFEAGWDLSGAKFDIGHTHPASGQYPKGEPVYLAGDFVNMPGSTELRVAVDFSNEEVDWMREEAKKPDTDKVYLVPESSTYPVRYFQ
jgi:hypothetical protein